MKTLLIMRHAKSDWSNAALADHDRPLNPRGQRDAPRMGQWLKQQELIPDLIISSTAKRAWQTAEALAYACGYENDIILTEDFYMAAPEIYGERLSVVENQHQIVMIVGHNPGLSDFLTEITDEYERMTTANIAHVALDIENWAEVDDDTVGRLLALWRPKEL